MTLFYRSGQHDLIVSRIRTSWKMTSNLATVIPDCSIMDDFDMDADDQIEQENEKSPEKKSYAPSGIEMEALHGLLDSYSTSDMKVRESNDVPSPFSHYRLLRFSDFSSSGRISAPSATATQQIIVDCAPVNGTHSRACNKYETGEYAECRSLPCSIQSSRGRRRTSRRSSQ